MYLLCLRTQAFLQGVENYKERLEVVSFELGVRGTKFIDPLENLGEAGYYEAELEFADLYETLLVLLDIDPAVVGLGPSPTRQLVLESGKLTCGNY